MEYQRREGETHEAHALRLLEILQGRDPPQQKEAEEVMGEEREKLKS